MHDAGTLWIEGDQAVYATGDELQQVPVVGGTPTTLYGGRDPGQTHDVFAHALTPTTFVWSELVGDHDGTGRDLERAARGQQGHGCLPPSDMAFFERMELAGDSVVVAGMSAHGRHGAGATGTTRPLSPGARLRGAVEPEGVYGFDVTGQPPNEDVHVRFAAGGRPAPRRSVGTTSPSNVGPDHIWADGDGG